MVHTRITSRIVAGLVAAGLATSLVALPSASAFAATDDPLPPPLPATVIDSLSPALVQSLGTARTAYFRAAQQARADAAPDLSRIRGAVLLEVSSQLEQARNAHSSYDAAVNQGQDPATLAALHLTFEQAAGHYRAAFAASQARHQRQIDAALGRLHASVRHARAQFAVSVRTAFAQHAPGATVPKVLLVPPTLGPGPGSWLSVGADGAGPADVGPAGVGPGTLGP